MVAEIEYVAFINHDVGFAEDSSFGVKGEGETIHAFSFEIHHLRLFFLCVFLFCDKVVYKEQEFEDDEYAKENDAGKNPVVHGEYRPVIAESKEIRPHDKNDYPECVDDGEKKEDFCYSSVSVF